ncbi:RNA-directed DNA polymerase, eukaryota, reverse transcriptase zinc-binding domain protein [Tanacetum coccineum]
MKNVSKIINDKRKIIIHGIAYWIRVKEFDVWVPDFEDDDDSLSSGEDAPIFNNDIEDTSKTSWCIVETVSGVIDPVEIHETVVGKYLDIFFIAKRSWKEITDGMVSRLSKWKVKTLSIGGRLTLLKSVLGAIPIYHMSIFKAPMKVLQNMEAIRARFFNRADLNTRKACWVSWKRVLNSKDRGGLGVSSMFAINRALLFIWVWRFITHKNSIWVRVIKALHGSHGRIGSITNNSYPSVWLSILQEVEVLKSKGIELLSFVTPVLGNGKSTSFWDVAWCGDVALKTLAPRIYDLESRKDIVVASKLAHNDLEKSLRRRPRGVSLNNSNDRWSWSLDGTGDFSVSSVRRHIDDHVLPSGNKKTRWIKEVPIKINIHAWKVSMDGLPTRFNLSRRGVEIDSIMCPLCDGHAESSSHLFFSCKNFCDTMQQVSRWWELDFRELHSYDEWLDWMLSIRLSSKLKKVFEGLCYIVWWLIWISRNKKVFGLEKSSYDSIFDETVYRSFYWIRSRSKVRFSWIDWLKNPSHIMM